jgi:6-phosphogluconolactonase
MPVKPAAVCPVNTGLPSAAAAAAAYQATLGKTFAAASMRGGWPCFDCILLGVGADGHTASLFPGDSAADNRTDWAAAGRAPDYSQRITLTLPVLNAARKVLFLASGPEKAAIVAAIAAGGVNFPAANVTAETVLWLLDAASGSGLER